VKPKIFLIPARSLPANGQRQENPMGVASVPPVDAGMSRLKSKCTAVAAPMLTPARTIRSQRPPSKAASSLTRSRREGRTSPSPAAWRFSRSAKSRTLQTSNHYGQVVPGAAASSRSGACGKTQRKEGNASARVRPLESRHAAREAENLRALSPRPCKKATVLVCGLVGFTVMRVMAVAVMSSENCCIKCVTQSKVWLQVCADDVFEVEKKREREGRKHETLTYPA